MPNLPIFPAAGAASAIGHSGDVCVLAPHIDRNPAARAGERESV